MSLHRDHCDENQYARCVISRQSNSNDSNSNSTGKVTKQKEPKPPPKPNPETDPLVSPDISTLFQPFFKLT